MSTNYSKGILLFTQKHADTPAGTQPAPTLASSQCNYKSLTLVYYTGARNIDSNLMLQDIFPRAKGVKHYSLAHALDRYNPVDVDVRCA